MDVIADVMRPLPFRDNSVDEVHASHLVEHVDDLLAVMGEVWRVCEPGAIVYFRFPHGTTKYLTWKDPTHKRAVFLDTFDYFDPETFDGKAFGYYHPAKFRMVRQRLCFNLNSEFGRHGIGRRSLGALFDWLANRNERSQYPAERFWGHWLGFEEAHIWLRALK